MDFTEEPIPDMFVFLGDDGMPYLVYDGWLHYWNKIYKGWTTLREIRHFELGAMWSRKIADTDAEARGWALPS